MSRKRKLQRVPLVPQQYEGRVECALNALAASVSASQHLTTYLTEQLGTEWRGLDYLIQAADRDLKQARRWLRGARRFRAQTRTRKGRR